MSLEANARPRRLLRSPAFFRVGAEGGGWGMSELRLTAVPVIALVLTFGVLVILLLII